MVSFVLIISFLLHIIMFVLIFQLYRQIETIKQSNTKEIQDVLSAYLREIKEENVRLLEAVSEAGTNEAEQPAQNRINPAPSPETADNAEDQIYENEEKDSMEASLHARILQLHDEGLTAAEIARKLNCGKTEAALIIKLYGKNE